jgi:hypothetical protein
LVAQARSEYENFLKVWKQADGDLPQVRQAEARVNGRALAADKAAISAKR